MKQASWGDNGAVLYGERKVASSTSGLGGILKVVSLEQLRTLCDINDLRKRSNGASRFPVR